MLKAFPYFEISTILSRPLTVLKLSETNSIIENYLLHHVYDRPSSDRGSNWILPLRSLESKFSIPNENLLTLYRGHDISVSLRRSRPS